MSAREANTWASLMNVGPNSASVIVRRWARRRCSSGATRRGRPISRKRLRSRRKATTNGTSRVKMTNARTSARQLERDRCARPRRRHQHAMHTRRLGVDDRDLEAGEMKALADVRHPPQGARERAAEWSVRGDRVGHRDPEPREDIHQRGASLGDHRAFGLGGARRHGLVVLVPDVPDQLLEEILERHQPRRAAVFVEHDPEVLALSQHLEQKLVAPFGGRGVYDRAQLRSLFPACLEHVEDVHHPDDLIDRTAVDRHTTVSGLRDEPRHLSRMRSLVDGEDRGSRCHHVGDRLLAEPHHAGDNLGLRVLADSLELPFTQQILDLPLARFLGHLAAGLPREWPRQRMCRAHEGPEQRGHGAQHRHQDRQHSRCATPRDRTRDELPQYKKRQDEDDALDRETSGPCLARKGERDAREPHYPRRRGGACLEQALLAVECLLVPARSGEPLIDPAAEPHAPDRTERGRAGGDRRHRHQGEEQRDLGDHPSRPAIASSRSKYTRSIRRRVTRSTTIRKPSSVSSSPARGTRPIAWKMSPPTVATSSRSNRCPSAVESSSSDTRPDTQKRRPSCSSIGASSTSYSSRISPTISSRMSSMVTSPAVPPYSSTTIAMCVPVARKSRSCCSTILEPGTNVAGRMSDCHPSSGARRVSTIGRRSLAYRMPTM